MVTNQAQVGKTFWLHCVRLKQSSNTTSPIWSLWWTCVRLGARPRRPVQITKFLWWMMWMASQWLFNMSHWLQTSWAWSLLHAPEQRGWPVVQSSRKLRRLGRLARKDSTTIPTAWTFPQTKRTNRKFLLFQKSWFFRPKKEAKDDPLKFPYDGFEKWKGIFGY